MALYSNTKRAMRRDALFLHYLYGINTPLSVDRAMSIQYKAGWATDSGVTVINDTF